LPGPVLVMIGRVFEDQLVELRTERVA
jgi:hypothetical protein